MSNSIAAEMRTIDPVLTTITQGFSNTSYVGEYLFPVVQINKANGVIPSFGKSSFVDRDLNRAPQSASNRLPVTIFDLLSYECNEKDVEMGIDYLEEDTANDYYKFEQRTARELSDILLLGSEIHAADLATTPENYPLDNHLALGEENALNNTSADPINMLRNSIEQIRQSIGIMPNTMILSNSSFLALVNNQFISEKIRYSGNNVLTTAILSQMLDIERIKVARSVYSPDGSNFEDVWKDNIVIAYSDNHDRTERSELYPSFGYTLRKKGMPEIDVYYEAGGKIKILRNTDNYCIKITSPEAGFLISNTIYQ